MGRIKTMLIKRTANSLVTKNPGKFKESFDENKKKVSEYAEVRSKKLRNIVAGYITRIVKKQKSEEI